MGADWESSHHSSCRSAQACFLHPSELGWCVAAIGSVAASTITTGRRPEALGSRAMGVPHATGSIGSASGHVSEVIQALRNGFRVR